MESRLIRFIEQQQVQLWKIFCTEQTQKGPGLLEVSLKDENVSVAYYPEDKIKRPEHQAEFREKFQLLEGEVQELEIENKWIVNMPLINPKALPYVPILYLVVEEPGHSTFFLGFPQPAQDNMMLQYVLVGNPPDKIEAKYDWTIAPTADGCKYLDFCQKAAKDDSTFQTFRSQLDYTKILIMGEKWHGQAYFQRIENEDPELLRHLEEFKRNDTLGEPQTFRYGQYGVFSANTLRYVNTLLDLRKHFNISESKDWNIVELGAGYGGLCCVMSSLVSWKEYQIMETPPVAMLANRYLEEMAVSNVAFGHLVEEDCDLFISEFALSELNEEKLDWFVENILSKAKRIYLAMNIWDKDRKIRLWEKLQEYFPNLQEKPEYPKTKWPNYIWFGDRLDETRTA
jgi:hypothetical protein